MTECVTRMDALSELTYTELVCDAVAESTPYTCIMKRTTEKSGDCEFVRELEK